MTAQQNIAYRRLFQNHSGKIGYWEGWVESTDDGARVVLQYAKTLDGKVTRREYAAKGKNLGRSNETTPLEQAQLELDSRARKQMDKGYVETQEAATSPSTNTLGLEKPMLATPFEKVKPEVIDWSSAYAQPKLDGHRALFKNGTLYSRQGKVLDLPHIVEAIEMSGADHLHLDGELYLHGRTLQEISSLVKRHQEETPLIEYHVYDCVADECFSARQLKLKEVLLYGFVHDRTMLVPTIPVNCLEDLMHLHEKNRSRGYEGTMLRFGSDVYLDGKRARSLLKVKDFSDAEFEIVGVERGTPYVTSKGTFEVPVWVLETPEGKQFRATAQGDRHAKHALWETRKEHIGKLLTVKFHYLSADGVPILPVALRFREDI